MILIAKAWQKGPSQVLPPSCRYQPSCSAYAITAIERYGAARGGWMALKRICRCHPWGGQGHDPVPERIEAQVNDSKNLILAVVLSALVLLGWTLGREQIFPDRQPAEHQGRGGKQQPLPQPQAQPSAPATPKATANRRRGARLGPARAAIRDAVAPGLDQSQGRADRRPAAAQPAADDRQEFAAGAAALAARRAGRLYRSVRLDRAGRRRRRRSTRCGPPTATRSDARPSGDADARRCPTARATRSRSRSTTAICSPSSRASPTRPAQPLSVRPIGLVSRAGKVARSRQLDQPCRPDRRVRRQGQL